MKDGPLFQRQNSFTRLTDVSTKQEATGTASYVRLQGSPENPGKTLNGQRLMLTPGGFIDVVAHAHGGSGIGRVAYTPGLKAAVKRGDQFTYRFEVPAEATEGTTYQVAAYGHDAMPAFRFVVQVAGRA